MAVRSNSNFPRSRLDYDFWGAFPWVGRAGIARLGTLVAIEDVDALTADGTNGSSGAGRPMGLLLTLTYST